MNNANSSESRKSDQDDILNSPKLRQTSFNDITYVVQSSERDMTSSNI